MVEQKKEGTMPAQKRIARIEEIMNDFHARADQIGIYPAVKELALALARAELRAEAGR